MGVGLGKANLTYAWQGNGNGVPSPRQNLSLLRFE